MKSKKRNPSVMVLKNPPKKKGKKKKVVKMAGKKRKQSAYNRFFATHRKKGLSPKKIGQMWRAKKGGKAYTNPKKRGKKSGQTLKIGKKRGTKKRKYKNPRKKKMSLKGKKGMGIKLLGFGAGFGGNVIVGGTTRRVSTRKTRTRNSLIAQGGFTVLSGIGSYKLTGDKKTGLFTSAGASIPMIINLISSAKRKAIKKKLGLRGMGEGMDFFDEEGSRMRYRMDGTISEVYEPEGAGEGAKSLIMMGLGLEDEDSEGIELLGKALSYDPSKGAWIEGQNGEEMEEDYAIVGEDEYSELTGEYGPAEERIFGQYGPGEERIFGEDEEEEEDYAIVGEDEDESEDWF